MSTTTGIVKDVLDREWEVEVACTAGRVKLEMHGPEGVTTKLWLEPDGIRELADAIGEALLVSYDNGPNVELGLQLRDIGRGL